MTTETPRERLAWAAAVTALWAAAVAAVVPRHEPWFDEAQAWLLARDLSLPQLLDAVRYEGSPALWHLSLWVLQRLGAPYAAMNGWGAAAAGAGAFLLAWRSPLPWVLRVSLPFAYFAWYQYAVVARSYTLTPLATALLAMTWPGRDDRPFRHVAALVLVGNLHLHGLLIAFGLSLVHLGELVAGRRWPSRRVLAAYGLLLAVVAFLGWQLRPPADLWADLPGLDRSAAGRAAAAWDALASALLGDGPAAFALLAVSCAWFWHRRCLAAFLVPAGLLLALFAFVRAGPWHQGQVFWVWVFALWQSFREPPTAPPRGDLAWLRPAVTGLALVVVAVQGGWAAASLWLDYHVPYTGTRAAAAYLDRTGLAATRPYAAGFSVQSVQPYFPENVFANYNGGAARPAYWVWRRVMSLPAGLDPGDGPAGPFVADALAARPAAVVVCFRFQPAAPDLLPGYRPVATFPGRLVWKGAVLAHEREDVTVYLRDDVPDPDAP